MEDKLKKENKNNSGQKGKKDEIEAYSQILENTKDITSQVEKLKNRLESMERKSNDVQEATHPRFLKSENIEELPKEILKPEKRKFYKEKLKIEGITKLEKETIKRLKKREKIIVRERTEKPSLYVSIANKMFPELSFSLSKKSVFKEMERDMIKSNLQFILPSYISVILFTTMISMLFAFFVFLFFLYFNLSSAIPIITSVEGSLAMRALKIFWILFAIPIATFLVMYFYPSMEKKSIEGKINQELPFATINMSAISNSMIEPIKIFSIIISTKEYPYLEKEFTKIMNEINVYGYNLVNALRSVAFNCPSKKLSELLNGISATITSGGSLPQFFEKRSQTLMFEHRLEMEKNTKYAETFMDIYISVVVAAPMILMLLLIMMKVSNLGISLSTSAISLIMVLGVSVVNILFLTFLHLKQPNK